MQQGKIWVDHKGNEYPSKMAMLRAYNKSLSTFNTRISCGWSVADALTIPSHVKRDASWVDHKGNEYCTKKAMLRAYNMGLSTFNTRIKNGWSLEDALTIPIREGKIKCKDHKGVTYKSIAEMCRKYNIQVCVYIDRIERGWSVKDALTKEAQLGTKCKDHKGNSYKSLTEMCRTYNISLDCYLSRRALGWDLESILTTPLADYTVKDHKGNVYASLNDMCSAYGISRQTFKYRIDQGWTLEEALTLHVDRNTRRNQKDIGNNTQKKTKTVIKDYDGNVYKSIKSLCDTFGISPSWYYKGLKEGKSLEYILNSGKTEVKDHKGIVYADRQTMCKAYGIHCGTYKWRMLHGFTTEAALTMPPHSRNYKGFCNLKQIGNTIYYSCTKNGKGLVLTFEEMDKMQKQPN